MPSSSQTPERPLPRRSRDGGARLLSSGQGLLLLLPMVAALFVFFLGPLVWLIQTSFLARGEFDLSAYQSLLHDPVVRVVATRTFLISVLVTVVTVLIGIPVAMLMASLKGRLGTMVTLIVVIPLWTSVLIRTYAWAVILRSNGVANTLLMKLGLISDPIQFMYTEFAVFIGMVHVLLPFAVLPAFTAFRAIPPELHKASLVLGAREFRTFLEITLPLARHGVISGGILTFMLAMGFFVTPALLGGPRSMTIATLIKMEVYDMADWQRAAAISVTLTVFSLIIAALFHRYMRVGADKGA